MHSHLLKKLEFSKFCRKKLWGSKNPKMACSKKVTLKERYIFFCSFLFLLQDNKYSCLVLKVQVFKLKIAEEVTPCTGGWKWFGTSCTGAVNGLGQLCTEGLFGLGHPAQEVGMGLGHPAQKVGMV